jgi:DNA-directed RNA polymerase specialized sigma24 family protein
MNRQLGMLALEVKQYPVEKKERRKALSILINGICCSEKLSRPSMGLPLTLRDEIYKEGLQNLSLWLCKNIEKYDSERGEVMAWVNTLLIKRFYPEAARSILGRKNEIAVKSSFWDNLSQEDLHSDLNYEKNVIEQFKKVRSYIQTDPKGILQQAKMKSNPDITFQKIALKKISGISWKQISEELNVPIPTLSNFYQRRLNKFRNELSSLS